MAQACGPLIDRVLQRVFDPAGVGTTRAQVRDLLSRAQQYICCAFESQVVSVPLTTQPTLQVYDFASIAPDILKLKSVRDGSRDLSEIEFPRLKQIDNHWFGRSGPRFETFSVLGRNILVIHPQCPVLNSVNVIYVQQLPALNVEGDPVNLPDDQITLLVKLTEALVLLKQRDIVHLQPLLADLTQEAKQEEAAA